MRPAVEYTSDEIMEFSKLLIRTEDVANELEKTAIDMFVKHRLTDKEVFFTLARVINDFILSHEAYLSDTEHLDAEAAFNDYLLACRDMMSDEADGTIGVEGGIGS